MSITTDTDAKQAAAEQAEPINMLINVSDIDESADSWDDISDEQIRQEITQSLDVISSERQYEGLIRDLAVTMWRSDPPRAPMGALVFETERAAVENGYWPNSMNKWEVEEILFELDIPTDVYNEAWEVVSMGVSDKMNPREEKDPNRV